jgi:voltage-gated potassium channel
MRPRIDVDKRFQLWYEKLTLPRAVGTVISVAFGLVIVAGALERLVEPKVFTSIGLAYWWAVVTVTTVGYGDVVPESAAGRVVATMLMLTGLGLIPTLTSVTVAVLIGKRTAAQQAQLDEQDKDHAEALARIEARLDQIAGDSDGSGKAEG